MAEKTRKAAKTWLGLTILALIAGGGGYFVYRVTRPGADTLLKRAHAAFEKGEYQAAFDKASEATSLDANLAKAWEIQLRSAIALDEVAQAEKAAAELLRIQPKEGFDTVLGIATRLNREHQLFASWRLFEKLQSAAPDDSRIRLMLLRALVIQGRRDDAFEHAFALIAANKHDLNVLMALGGARDIHPDFRLINSVGADPTDSSARMCVAARAVYLKRFFDAEQLLRKITKEKPGWGVAHAMLGISLRGQGKWRELGQWANELPGSAYEDSWTLGTIGSACLECGDPQTASRYLWESLKRTPGDSQPNAEMAKALALLGRGKAAQRFAQRAKDLRGLRQFLGVVRSTGGLTPDRMIEAAERTERVGRLWEAVGWSRLLIRWSAGAEKRFDVDRAVVEKAKAIESRLEARLEASRRTIKSANLALSIDLTGYAINRNFDFHGPRDQGAATVTNVGVRYEDDAQRAKLIFKYHNARHEPMRMAETIGSGIAVLDYDLDGYPDLYFSQGSDWPPGRNQGGHTDRLFRNNGDGTFEDVTDFVGIREEGYSQGVTVGDVNSDGYPDLFVANFGRNRLYVNNGDGTFRDATEHAGFNRNDWSTSCVFCDLNGDQHPDLYVVNYLSDRKKLDKPCPKNDDCVPASFPAAQDRFWLNLGDGTFREVSKDAGVDLADGKGLGVLAADFSGTGNLALLVANDTLANFFITRDPADKSRGGVPKLLDEGGISGLAYNRDGAAEACMGIACDDADGDGDLDLFVTNFFQESNTLYIQKRPLKFDDLTNSAGLSQSSMGNVAWGTHFTDADRDGKPDLVVMNGHVHYKDRRMDHTRMHAQFYRNITDDDGPRFAMGENAALGPYFETRRYGRAAVLLDWNRDGKEDVCVGHLFAPFALLTNRTENTNHHLVVHLVGTRSPREAVGAVVTVEHEGGKRIRQLVAGCGFHCSNERSLHFGLGESKKIRKVTVRWPSGAVQSFENVEVDTEVKLIEGRLRAFRLPGRESES